MVLKDIKNDPGVNAGLHPPLGLTKRRMSDTGCQSSLPHKSKIRRGSLQKGASHCFTSSRSEHNTMNICSDLTNGLQSGSLALQNKKGIKSGYCEVESTKQGGLKNDGMVPTVKPLERLPNIHLTSPECYSGSTHLDISSMSSSFFADPTVDLENEAPETAEITSNIGNKYFSTPMVPKRVKKKLTPVMELEVESYTTNEWRSPPKISSPGIIHKNLNAGISHESPSRAPLYRSFFAEECQEIVNQLEGIESILKSPVKRKAEVLDVSTIEAEPPPYDCTPMKSMLACEVANMIRSLDNSPVKEGVSLFGESLLDLENIDMQLHDFDLSECSKGKSFSDSRAEGIVFDDFSGGCSKKRQKTEQLDKIKSEPNSITPVKGLLANIVNNVTLQKFDNKESDSDCTNKSGTKITKQYTQCSSEGVTLYDPTQLIKMEEKHLDTIEQVFPFHHENFALNTSKFIEVSPKDLVNTTQNIVNESSFDELHNATTHVIREEWKIPVNTTLMHMVTTTNTKVPEFLSQTSVFPQDIPSMPEEVSLANTTQVIELVSQSSANITQDISPMLEKTATVDTTQVIKVGPRSSASMTLGILSMHELEATANTTHVIDIGTQPSGNATQDILSVNEEVLASNTTQVFEEETQTSANTTHDIALICDMVPTANTTQVTEVGPQHSASTTQDIASIDDMVPTANTTQVTEVGPQHSANTTQDIASIDDMVPTANTTQVTEVGPQHSANTTQDIASIDDLVKTANTTQITEVGPQHSANTTQDMSSVHDMVNAKQLTEVSPQSCANIMQDIASIHDTVNAANTTQVTEVGPQSSANTTQDIASMHDIVNTTQVTEVGPQCSTSTTQDTSVHKDVSIASSVQIMEVVPQLLSSNTLIASLKGEVITTNPTDNMILYETLTNKTQNINLIHDEVIKININKQNISTETKKMETEAVFVAINPHPVDAVLKNTPTITQDVASLPEVPVANTHLYGAVPQTSLNPVQAMSGNNGIVIGDLPSHGATEHLHFEDLHLITDISEDSLKNISLKEMVAHKTLQVPEAVEDQKHSVIMTCDVDCGTVKQSKSNVTDMEMSKATEEKCNQNSSEKVSSQNEVDGFKESNNPLLSESCSTVQEEENVHDVSVFSAGSLSFVTSTPVPGFNNFQFQKTYRDSVQQDPNVSIGSVLEESTNKVLVEHRIAPQQKVGFNGNNQVKQIQRASMVPPSTERGIRPPSGLIPRQIPSTSSIPSARRSLALLNNPTCQNPAKDPLVSKTVPRGIPGRGMIRPPMVRQSLQRVSSGIMKQSTEETGGNQTTNKLKGNQFRTPKPAAAKLPIAALVKPPSRLTAPNITRIAVGAQNATNILQDPASGETVTSVRPQTATEIRTCLPKPGSSAIRPPLLQSQKLSPKLKSNLPGLSVKKTLPALGSRKDIASAKGATMSARSSTKQSASSAANETASFQVGVKCGTSLCRIEPTAVENLKLQSSISSLEDCPATSETEKCLIESEKCLHLETCKCCHLRYQQLLQELEDLKKRLVEHSCKGKE